MSAPARGNNDHMQVFLDDTLITALLTLPIREGWVDTERFSRQPGIRASDVGPENAALLPAGEMSALAGSHAIVPEVAVVCDGVGAIAMRTPVRPDAVETSIIHLYDVSRTAELLLRATLRPFFGITASEFVADASAEGAAEAQVVLVEGIEAMRNPEAGFQEDLCRAWFILTGLRLVSHVLIVPIASSDDDVATLVRDLRQLIDTGVERRRDVRMALAADNDLDRDRLAEVTNRLRWSLERPDVDSLQMLFARGTWGTTVPRTMPTLRAAGGDTPGR